MKEELGQGKSFEELAKNTLKIQVQKKKAATLGYLTASKMVKEFEDAAYKLKKDEVSEPVKSHIRLPHH